MVLEQIKFKNSSTPVAEPVMGGYTIWARVGFALGAYKAL